DLIVVGDWMAVNIFINDNGVIENNQTIPNSMGWWNRIEPADLDNDGDNDFILGNWGTNTKFKASPARPVTMYVNDFDGNGKSEFIINWYPPLDSTAYPFTTKSEITSQLPALRKSILRYADYANQTYDSLFSSDVRSRSIAYKVDYLSSAILWNDQNKFSLSALPPEAQVSPVFGIVADDLDADGIIDIWLGGNFYALKPQVGRHDASKGVYLKGVSKRSFVNQQHSGIYVRGEVRDAIIMRSAKSKQLFVARNNDRVLVFRKK
ncbi:MAG: hypothetical protein C0490_00880, partial [Marivirga sp.]|nr:hypothetical protein [Marivirga sp.]